MQDNQSEPNAVQPQESSNVPDLTSQSEKVIQPISDDLKQPSQSTAVSSMSMGQDFDPGSIYPTPVGLSRRPAEDSATITSTTNPPHITREKALLPLGVYIIAAWSILGFILSLFTVSRLNIILIALLLINFLLAIGLLLRQELARKLTVGISIVLGVAWLIILIGTIMVQQRVHTLSGEYDTAISKVELQRTPQQQQAIQVLGDELHSKQRLADNALGLSYVRDGVSLFAALVVTAYLSEAEVKDAFRKKDVILSGSHDNTI